jgi:hypothetical protein
MLAMDRCTPGPDKALRADAHAVANGPIGVVDEVEKMTARVDDDRSRPLVRRVGDDLAGEGGSGPRDCSHGVKTPALVVPPAQATIASSRARAAPRTTRICREGHPANPIFIATS